MRIVRDYKGKLGLFIKPRGLTARTLRRLRIGELARIGMNFYYRVF